MQCSPIKTAQNTIRFFLFPVSKYISEKTNEIDQRLMKIRAQKEVTTQLVGRVNQPDILRSLVVSMQSGGGKK